MTMPDVSVEIGYVPGATALGIWNRQSTTGSLAKFQASVAEGPYEFIVMTLGEVDTAYTIWMKAESTGAPLDTILQTAINRYNRFLDTLPGPVFVISATLPTIGDDADCDDEVHRVRRTVHAPLGDRTALALRFNGAVRDHCAGSESLHYVDLDAAALGRNGEVRRVLRHPLKPCEHHYFRPVYAALLGAALMRERVRLALR